MNRPLLSSLRRGWYALSVSMVMVPAVYSATWDEAADGGGDADDRLPTAQVPIGSGPLTSITGANSSGADGDLYKIYLPNPSDFVATTVGGAGHDTILYLFDTAGHVWVAQDDDTNLQSTLFFAPGQPTPLPGNFYVGITPFNLHILDANGESMFDHPGFASYNGTSPITSNSVVLWANTTFEFDHFDYLGSAPGPYTIELRNAEFMIVPEPSGVLLAVGCLVGLMGALGRRLR